MKPLNAEQRIRRSLQQHPQLLSSPLRQRSWLFSFRSKLSGRTGGEPEPLTTDMVTIAPGVFSSKSSQMASPRETYEQAIRLLYRAIPGNERLGGNIPFHAQERSVERYNDSLYFKRREVEAWFTRALELTF